MPRWLCRWTAGLQPPAVPAPLGPGQQGVHDLAGHGAQRLVALVRVRAGAQVDLREAVQPADLQQVDEQPDLDAVGGDERHLLQR